MITLTAAQVDAWLAAFFYPFFRFMALTSTAPVLSHASVPARVRIGLALMFTVVVAPTIPQPAFVSPFSAAGVAMIAQQILLGAAIGFALEIVFAAASLAGEVMGLQMGLSFASFVDPQGPSQQPLIGSLLNIGVILLFLAIDGHLRLIGALAESFRAFPLDQIGPGLDPRGLALAGAQVFTIGLSVALPVIAALLLANLALGVLTRTAPQLNLFAVGFPITLAAGLAMLLFALPFVLPPLEAALERAFLLVVR
jgi:flagellar biosynthesis protein FliR